MRLTLPSVLLALAATVTTVPKGVVAVTPRTIFVSVVDKAGQFVSGLKPADFVVKEGGALRDVVGVEPASGPAAIAILFEEGLTRDTDARLAVVRLIQQMQNRADMSIIVAGQVNTTIVPYTPDGAALVVGMNALSRGPRPLGGHIVEGILDAARDLGTRSVERRIVIALTVDQAEIVSVQPDEVIGELRKTGTTLYVIALRGSTAPPSLDAMIDSTARSQVLANGSTKSGGRQEIVTRTVVFPAMMIALADEIQHQHKLTYHLPDGVKPDARLSVSMTRKELKVRAPTQIGDR